MTSPRYAAETTVDLGEVELYVRRLGDPALPALLAVHGGPSWDHSYLLPAVGLVADLRHIVLVDLCGCGRSSRCLPIEAYRHDASRRPGRDPAAYPLPDPAPARRERHGLVENATHMAQFERPVEWTGHLRRFFAS